jgi:hypothetical protein
MLVFAELRGSMLIDDPTSQFATAGGTRTDWLTRVGLSWPDARRGAMLYAQLERITDPGRLNSTTSSTSEIANAGRQMPTLPDSGGHTEESVANPLVGEGNAAHLRYLRIRVVVEEIH